MIRPLARYTAIALLFGPSIWADATLRYHTDVQTSSMIPAAALDQALGGIRDMVVRIKGTKAYSSQGNVNSIMDLTTQDLIMVDAVNKRFAKVPAGQYAEQLKKAVPAVPEQARAVLASMQSNLESRATGRTAVIQGIQAEEREFVLSINMALPGVPQTSSPSPFMKMVMQIWTAKPEEAQRVPALQEFKNYTASANWVMNPAETIKQVAGMLPGMGDQIGAMMDEMSKTGAMSLRMHTEVFMPFLVLMSQQLPQQAGGPLPAGIDPNAPLMKMSQELVELSTDPLDDALFQVPADYQQASIEQILKAAVPAAAPPQFQH
jgi:hypothetical protein